MSIDEKSSYYDVGGIETIEVIRAKLTPEQFAGYCLGNVMKYSTRMMHKGCAERDAEKVSVYAGLLRDHVASADAGESTADTGERQPRSGDRIRIIKPSQHYSKGDTGVLQFRVVLEGSWAWLARFDNDDINPRYGVSIWSVGSAPGEYFELIGDDE